jgi:hypothetical protein
MDGVQMVMTRLLSLLGIDPAMIEQLKEEIPKFRAAIPAFAQDVNSKVQQVSERIEALYAGQASLGAKLDAILAAMGEHGPASDAIPADPLAPVSDVKAKPGVKKDGK